MQDVDIKLAFNQGVKLVPTGVAGLSSVTVLDAEKRFDLTWDRFARLFRVAEAIKEIAAESSSILDVGGFDGALALFLPQHKVDVIDPISTGGCGLSIDLEPYEVVASVDALEHVAPERRNEFLGQLLKVAKKHCLINFPSRRSKAAQELVLSLTDNPLVREHVIWELPCALEVESYCNGLSFKTEILKHTSTAQWVSQYLLQTVSPDHADKVNRYLLAEHMDQPVDIALYDLVIATRA